MIERLTDIYQINTILYKCVQERLLRCYLAQVVIRYLPVTSKMHFGIIYYHSLATSSDILIKAKNEVHV